MGQVEEERNKWMCIRVGHREDRERKKSVNNTACATPCVYIACETAQLCQLHAAFPIQWTVSFFAVSLGWHLLIFKYAWRSQFIQYWF